MLIRVADSHWNRRVVDSASGMLLSGELPLKWVLTSFGTVSQVNCVRTTSIDKHIISELLGQVQQLHEEKLDRNSGFIGSYLLAYVQLACLSSGPCEGFTTRGIHMKAA